MTVLSAEETRRLDLAVANAFKVRREDGARLFAQQAQARWVVEQMTEAELSTFESAFESFIKAKHNEKQRTDYSPLVRHIGAVLQRVAGELQKPEAGEE